MKDKIEFIRLPMVLLLIYFVGRLILGASGASWPAALVGGLGS